MCGRFSLSIADYDTLAELVGVGARADQAAHYRPRYNVAPTDEHWLLRHEHDQRALARARWGFRTRTKRLLINARAEGADANARFRDSFQRRRCVVPADGFFEWTGTGKQRAPIWFHAPRGSWLALAGLYRVEADGTLAFTILTTEPNDLVRPVHDRMPAVLPLAHVDAWLAHPAHELLAPAPADALIATPVSRRVNSVRHDDAACLEPAAPPAAAPRDPQGSLF